MSEILLHRQFESQAAAAPERIALVSGAEREAYNHFAWISRARQELLSGATERWGEAA